MLLTTQDWTLPPPSSTLPVLPSYEAATNTFDASRLPSYRPARSHRYHPYERRAPRLVDGTGIDRLFNTIYDEERVDLTPPPPLPQGPPPTQPLVRGLLVRAQPNPFGGNGQAYGVRDNQGGHYDAEEHNRRAQQIATVVLQEFVAGLRRAHQA